MCKKKFKISYIALLVAFLVCAILPGVHAVSTGYKVSGYIAPDFSLSQSQAGVLKAGFEVKLSGIVQRTCTTDQNGYFEFLDVPGTVTPGIPSSTMPYTITISKQDYLARTIGNVAVSSDITLSTKESPVQMWAGDMMINGQQDGAINMSDIMYMIRYFNSAYGDEKYVESCDLNKDKAINMTDIMIVIRHFNTTAKNYPEVKITIPPEGRIIYCASAAEIQDALTNAQPGDRIIIRPGEYEGSWINDGYYYSPQSGTSAKPIILESEDPLNPATLRGRGTYSGYVLHITGDYWQIRNLKISTGQKGIMMDNSNHSLIYGCEVSNIGHEGIHLRDGSSNNTVDNCSVHDTGKLSAGFGEGIYVGSDKGKWSTFEKACDNNVIRNCTLGPNVSAEHVDIKEGTTGTIIENCIMNGTGVLGQNYADSFIDAKGNDAIIRNNTCYRNNNSIIVDAFQVHQQVEGWGLNNDFHDNKVYLDDGSAYVVNAPKGTAKVSNNMRSPSGNMYKGNVTEY